MRELASSSSPVQQPPLGTLDAQISQAGRHKYVGVECSLLTYHLHLHVGVVNDARKACTPGTAFVLDVVGVKYVPQHRRGLQQLQLTRSMTLLAPPKQIHLPKHDQEYEGRARVQSRDVLPTVHRQWQRLWQWQ